MPSFDVFAIIGFVLVLVLLAVLFLLPTDKAKPRKKPHQDPLQQKQEDDWQAVSLKLEGHIKELRQKLTVAEKKARLLEKEAEINKQKCAHLEERLEQERGWKKKETQDGERMNKESVKLKDDLKKTEDNLHSEHSQRLRMEREVKELKDNLASTTEKWRAVELELTKTKNQSDVYRSEISNLKVENAKLSQKKEEASFVAKSEYDRVVALLKDREKDVERLRPKA